MTDDEASSLRSNKDRFRSDFAVVCAGYLAGQGILRLSIAFLVGVNDKPRAELLERWLPFWNALAFFIAAWGVHRLILWFRLPQFRSPMPNALMESPAAVPKFVPAEPTIPPVDDWKSRLKAAQKRKDVDAILDIRRSIGSSISRERAKSVDRRLGKWFTKHFQRMMLSGRAAESLPDVERVAEHYSDSEEFAYFQEILPVVRQCASIKASVDADEEPGEKP